jgi:hypothetical protein
VFFRLGVTASTTLSQRWNTLLWLAEVGAVVILVAAAVQVVYSRQLAIQSLRVLLLQ